MKNQIIYLNILLLSLFFSCERTDIWNTNNQKIDDIAPTVVSAQSINNTQVEVRFGDANGEIDRTTAEDPANYSIPSLTITSAVRDTADLTLVVLTTSSQQNTNYTITVTGVLDKFENEIGTPNTAAFNGDPLPYISYTYPLNNTTVRVVFSEPVTGVDLADFTSPTLTLISFSIVNSTTYNFLTAPQTSALYIVEIITNSGITDATGNAVDTLLSWTNGDFTGDAPPNISGINLIDQNTIEVVFSEPVDITTSQDGTNYTIPGITINPVASRHTLATELNIVTIYLSTPLTVDTGYQITVVDVLDAQGVPGNLIHPTYNNPYSFTTPLSF